MITRQNLNIKNEWWFNKEYKISEASLPKRDLFSTIEDNLKHPLILNIVGLRRVGKSTLLKQIIHKLLEQKIPPLNIFYFLFDYSSKIQKKELLDETLAFYFQEIIKKPNLSLDEKVYIFLDEIQYIEDWQSVVKHYYDLSGKKIKFIITGSQSILLKGKYHESLAGRIFDYYLAPLSFREFLKINNETIQVLETFDLFNVKNHFNDLSLYHTYCGSNISQLSREYITTGQFPEIRQLQGAEKKQEYITESIIGKVLEDSIRIFDIKKTDEFKLIAWQLLNNVGSIFELTNLAREIAISKLTTEKYFQYLKESYIIEVLYKYHKSPIKRGRILKKLYTPCVNFVCALNHYTENHIEEIPQAFGKIVENVVYNVLQSKYKNKEPINNMLNFWRKGEKEIDFILSYSHQYLPIEVKFSNNIGQKDLSVMIHYMNNKKIEYGIIVTPQKLAEEKIKGKTLYFLPYSLFLLMI